MPEFTIGSTLSTYMYGRLSRKNNRYYAAAPGYFVFDTGGAYKLDTGGTSPGTGDVSTWPLLTNSGQVSGFGSAPPADTGFDHFHSCMELASGNLLASICTDYATQTNQINGAVLSQNTTPTRTDYSPVARMIFGGHLGWVPTALLPYVGSRTAYGAGLGSKSGQGYTQGPSLFLFDPTNPSDTLVVFYNPDKSSNDTTTIQQRPNTISGPGLFNGLSGQYWQIDHIEVAILTDYGMAFIATLGEGTPSYPIQNYTLSTGMGVYFGCIPLATIIAAIQAAPPGGPGTVHVPSWELWSGKVGSFREANTGWNYPPGPKGGWYDTSTKIVHLFNQFSWLNGSTKDPTISMYDLSV